MEERPLDDPSAHSDLSPEARRKAVLWYRAGLQTSVAEHIRQSSRIIAVGKRVWTGAYYDGFIHAGNLAYMSILALFPFFIVASAVFSLIGEPSQREASIDAFLSAVPPVVAKVIEPVARDVVAARTGWFLWVGGIVGLWTTSSLLETIRDILHRAYGTPQTQAFWHYRLVSSGVVFISVVLLLFSLFAQVAIGTAEEVIVALFPRLDSVLESLTFSRLITSIALYISIYLLFYSLTPGAYRARHYPKWPGALLITIWWVATSLLLPGILRRFFTYDLTYGSLAGVMIALFFFWLVGLGIVVGAELNAALAVSPEERDMRNGSRREDVEGNE